MSNRAFSKNYCFMIGIVISTIIIVVTKIIHKHYTKNKNSDCINFRDSAYYILSIVSLLINFYLIIPRELYYYQKYMKKLNE